MLLPNLAAAATITSLQGTCGNANSNGIVLDLQTYKGPVAFILAVQQSTVGVGSLNAQIEGSADNVTFALVSGGQFTNVVNSANASNVGAQVLSFDVRALPRYVRGPFVISGTNANVPATLVAIGQKERV